MILPIIKSVTDINGDYYSIEVLEKLAKDIENKYFVEFNDIEMKVIRTFIKNDILYIEIED